MIIWSQPKIFPFSFQLIVLLNFKVFLFLKVRFTMKEILLSDDKSKLKGFALKVLWCF